MVPKPTVLSEIVSFCFRAVLFRMVPKLSGNATDAAISFRAVLFRMVPKQIVFVVI